MNYNKMLFKLCFNILMLHFCSFTVVSAANLIVEKSYLCKDVPNQKVKFTITPKTFTYPQVLDIALITPIPLGNQLKYIADIELENKFALKGWQCLLKIEDDFCRVMQVYMGNFAYDFETAMGILPRGACPIPKGNYHAVNYTIDSNLMKLQAFPIGRMRVTGKFVEKSNKNIVLCMVGTISSLY